LEKHYCFASSFPAERAVTGSIPSRLLDQLIDSFGLMATAGISDNIGWWSKFRPSLGLLPSIVALALAVVSSPIVPAGSWLQFDLDSLGWLSFVVGAGFRWWGALYMAGSPRGALVTTGPFSICRNPMQIGNLLLGSALVLFVGSATFGAGFVLGTIVYLSIVVGAEQKGLARRFGSDYRQYCQRVPRFSIRPSLFHSPETLFIGARELGHELRFATLWMWLPVIGKTLAQLRAEAWWPHLIRLP
jgi:protein-S-isoprenylcysteine O-methyltransferase Ste14